MSGRGSGSGSGIGVGVEGLTFWRRGAWFIAWVGEWCEDGDGDGDGFGVTEVQ